MKNLKLWEAIGLLLILGSWCLEWSSVRKWDDTVDNYWRYITTFHNNTFKMNNQIGWNFELSINRSVKGMRLDPQDFGSAYKLAWEYAEVRKLWFERAFNVVNSADTLIKVLLEIKRKYNLDVKIDLNALEKAIKGTENELAKYVDKQDPISKIVPIPMKEKLTSIQAGYLDKKIQKKIIPALSAPINNVADAMNEKRNFRSLVFRTLFAVGSLILIFAKVIEWWKNKKEGHTKKQMKSTS